MDYSKELIGFVIASKRKIQVLKALSKKPKRPYQLARELKMYASDVSRLLFKLEKKKLIECITPNKKAWRVYMITDLGNEVLKKL
ncbi:MAG: ArsR family transcriptional regulator [Nanoarchaeota archaeon]|nr:ArsR family transcriptional regulator [Nanoarchaeota archaeon]